MTILFSDTVHVHMLYVSEMQHKAAGLAIDCMLEFYLSMFRYLIEVIIKLIGVGNVDLEKKGRYRLRYRTRRN